MEPIPRSQPVAPVDATIERDLAEVDAAIALVDHGTASRVLLVGLSALDRIAAMAVARGQAAGVRVRLERHGDATALTIDPLP